MAHLGSPRPRQPRLMKQVYNAVLSEVLPALVQLPFIVKHESVKCKKKNGKDCWPL